MQGDELWLEVRRQNRFVIQRSALSRRPVIRVSHFQICSKYLSRSSRSPPLSLAKIDYAMLDDNCKRQQTKSQEAAE